MDRRSFLTHVAASGAVIATPRLVRAASDSRVTGAPTVVLIHLFGGNDGLNTVIPYQDPQYRRLRPTIAVPDNQIRKVHGELGFHPSLAGFQSLWERERLAVVNGVGYPQPSYSHFRSTEIWHSGLPDGLPKSGWLGRVIDANPKQRPIRAIALARERPLALQSSRPGVVTLTSFEQFRIPAELEAAAKLYEKQNGAKGALGQVARAGAGALKAAKKIAALKTHRGPPYGALGNRLRQVLALLKADVDLEAIQLGYGGFDTHANQAGSHANLLAQVGSSLSTYQRVLDDLGIADRVLTIVFSEFGRRPGENRSGGTDHGSAGPMFVVGKRVRPGMHGAQPSLDDLDRGNLKYTTDFRAVYGAVAGNFMKVDPKSVSGGIKPLELIG